MGVFVRHKFLFFLFFAFILKGLVFTSIIPIFQGPDEYVHYSTVQYLAEPKEKNWPITYRNQWSGESTKNISDFAYTQEIIAFAELTDNPAFAGSPQNTQDLNQESVYLVTQEMESGKYHSYVDRYPPYIIHSDFSHRIASYFEKMASEQNFFNRYFIARLPAIFYGLIVVICAYLIALWSGFRQEHALLFSAIVAFQPQLTATTAIINYDPLLIASYSVVLAGATSVLRHSLNWKNVLTMLVATAIAIVTKATGGILIFLVAGVILFGLRERFSQLKSIQLWKVSLFSIATIGTLFLITPKAYTDIITQIPFESRGKTIFQSIGNYLSGNIFDGGKYERTSVTYWGTFGWLDTTLHDGVMQFIRIIEYIACIGLFLLILSRLNQKVLLIEKLGERIQLFLTWLKKERSFLPESKFLLFFFFSLFLLQFAIRFYDWYGGYTTGNSVGTPGRYFLPNIIPHLLLVVSGLGMFVKSSRAFGYILKSVLSGIVILSLYSIFWIIIPRYYL